MTKLYLTALPFLLLGTLLVACGGDDEAATTSPSPNTASASAGPAGTATPTTGPTRAPTPVPTEDPNAVRDDELSGRIVYVSTTDSNADIWIMNADGTNAHALTDTTASDTFPEFSPDGTQIAFQRGPDVWVMNADGSGAQLIVSSAAGPTWSPDGTQIAATAINGNELDIGVISLNTGEVRPLVQAQGVTETYPAWSPDGSLIAFFSNSPGFGLFTIPADGSAAPTALTNEGLLDVYPDWSRDGTRLTFATPFDGHNVVAVVSADGTGRANIGDTTWTTNYPAWSPDGCCIAYTSAREDGNWDVFVMRADGTGGRRLTTTESIDGDLGLDWAE